MAFCPFPVVPSGFKRNLAGNARNKVAAFGIERYQKFTFAWFFPEIAAHGAQGHFMLKGSLLGGLVVDGENSAVKFLIVAIEILSQLFAEEPLLGIGGMRMLKLSPVQLPAGVRPQFVETAVLDGLVQNKESVASAVVHFNQFPFHKIPVIVQQFHIQDFADLRGRAIVCAS